MKQKRLMSIISLLLSMTMLCSLPVHAAEIRGSTRIYTSSVTFAQKSNGDFSIAFSVRATRMMNVIGASSVEIQRNTISGWVTEYIFTPDNTPELQAENRIQYNTTLTYSPLFVGKEYRAVVMIYVEDAEGVSTQQLTSRTA